MTSGSNFHIIHDLVVMTLTKTTTLVLLVVTFTIAITIPQAQAHDSNSSIMTLFPFDADDGDQKIWYNMASLAEVTLDGQSNAEGIRLIAEVSRAAIDSTDMNLSISTSLVLGSDNILDARDYMDTRVYGETRPYGLSSGSGLFKIVWLNNDDRLNYDSFSACRWFWEDPNPEYIMNHEFGHLAGLAHHTAWPFDDTHTAMKRGCNPGEASLRTEDKNDINRWYD